MDRDFCRDMTIASLERELNNLKTNYMRVYDEYYETCSRHSAFLKDLVDSIIGISAVLEVYARDKNIHPSYALEKLNNSKSYIEANIRFFENLLKEENIENE